MASEQVGDQRHITKQSAQGCWGKVIRPYTIGSSSASRHHTDSLGDEHRQGEGLRGSSSSASRLLGRYMKYRPRTTPGAPAAG